LLLWLPLLWPQRGLPDRGEVELQVIDVGQGLSVLVRTSRHALLYDTGPAVLDGFDAGESAVVPTLHALGVRRLDVVTISHGDNDHAGGFAAVVRTFPPALALTPEGAPPLPQGRPCRAGLNWQWDGVRFRFLHPPRFFPYLGNEAGCVLRVESAHGVALLPADIGEVIEQTLLHRDLRALRADVVLMPHHGSGGSSTPGFIAATGARFAIASSGYDNRFRHPRPEVVQHWGDAGAQVINTAETGAVRVRMLASGITVERERGIRPRSWDAVQRHARAIQAPASR
jgi:competence protein ComEC